MATQGCLPCFGESELTKVDNANSANDAKAQNEPIFSKVVPLDTPGSPMIASGVPSPGASAEAGSQYFALRQRLVNKFFEGSIGVDDFMARVEMQLWSHGFTGDNSISVLNLCRDEICNSLKNKVEAIFGEPFNLHGLGAVLTCGTTGIGACLSHAPQINQGAREKYVFFSFPHVAVNASGELGKVSREGRHDSHACGALLKVQGELQNQDSIMSSTTEGHDVMDPEYSILKQRLEQHMISSGFGHKGITLDNLTKIAERAITSDLEKLIMETVDVSKADYAVVTGIQIHNWSDSFTNMEEPSLEFIQPCKAYTVIHGRRTNMNIHDVPSLTPRMISILASINASGSGGSGSDAVEAAPFVDANSRSKSRFSKNQQKQSGFASMFNSARNRRSSLMSPTASMSHMIRSSFSRSRNSFQAPPGVPE